MDTSFLFPLRSAYSLKNSVRVQYKAQSSNCSDPHSIAEDPNYLVQIHLCLQTTDQRPLPFLSQVKYARALSFASVEQVPFRDLRDAWYPNDLERFATPLLRVNTTIIEYGEANQPP